MAHFTVEQIRDLATAYFIGRDTQRRYPTDWFNGGEELFYDNGSMISLEEAISLYANDEEECYYNEPMSEDYPDFFNMMGEDFKCEEVYYDWDEECNMFLNANYLHAITEAWENTIGASIIDSIRKEYYHYAKGYNASC